jgi:hypothetical protein
LMVLALFKQDGLILRFRKFFKYLVGLALSHQYIDPTLLKEGFVHFYTRHRVKQTEPQPGCKLQ